MEFLLNFFAGEYHNQLSLNLICRPLTLSLPLYQFPITHMSNKFLTFTPPMMFFSRFLPSVCLPPTIPCCTYDWWAHPHSTSQRSAQFRLNVLIPWKFQYTKCSVSRESALDSPNSCIYFSVEAYLLARAISVRLAKEASNSLFSSYFLSTRHRTIKP